MNSYITKVTTCITPIIFDFEEPDNCAEVVIPLVPKQDLSKMVVRMDKTVYSKMARISDEELKKGVVIEKTKYIKRSRKCIN